MGREARGNLATATFGRSGTGNECAVLYAFPFPLATVEDTSPVYKKSQHLDGRLRTVEFYSGHVDIIDEDSDFLSRGCPEGHTRLLELLFY